MVPGLRRYARALLHDATAADDLVQDCLERAISRWNQRRGDAVRPWLYAILHNLAVNRLKQRSRRGAHMPIDAVPEGVFAQAPRQDQALHQQDVLRAIERLPEDQRAVLLLVTVEDLSYEDAAATLQVPVGTIMSRLSRARERLRRILDGTEPAMISHLRRVK
ncbi:sigma-70 family RNA polymerase sigma factor [Sphingomonas sp. H39-1-10]|uniref:sigma-70 family RNA polymerase sigma factor n=1 Tax=Sphingomonas pollutisoli TaxID=3030829 RepID=UPI0023B995CC|nr:sigma-70 family RNA polymerase sigma factor [Sphingomonas pollutisoli]MDF0491593.1 sigma-70 family RNA polymerase sigma factor [Sphingomonas pollutisoli]